MIDEKEIEVSGIKFIIGKFPATVGREIITQYPVSGLPKIGSYKTNEELMIKILGYCDRVDASGKRVNLNTKGLIDGNIPDWETLMKLEWEIMKYNCSFLASGEALNLWQILSNLADKKLTEILTRSLAQLSQAGKQPSGN